MREPSIKSALHYAKKKCFKRMETKSLNVDLKNLLRDFTVVNRSSQMSIEVIRMFACVWGDVQRRKKYIEDF